MTNIPELKYTLDEVKTDLICIPWNKTPGPNGFTGELYETHKERKNSNSTQILLEN